MGKGHRDNHEARKKRGPVAFKKKAERRRPHYTGPYSVTFTCGEVEHVPLATPMDVEERVRRIEHRCSVVGCKPERFKRSGDA